MAEIIKQWRDKRNERQLKNAVLAGLDQEVAEYAISIGAIADLKGFAGMIKEGFEIVLFKDGAVSANINTDTKLINLAKELSEVHGVTEGFFVKYPDEEKYGEDRDKWILLDPHT